MRRRSAFLVLAPLLALPLRLAAATPVLEINGREFFGSVYTDGGEPLGPLDVVGPLLLGSDFVLESYDLVLRKASFHWVPPGTSQPVRGSVSGCAKRGAAVYAPLRALLKEVGGSYQQDAEVVRVAYPPAGTLVAQPTPTPTTASPVIRPTAPSTVAPTPEPVALLPSSPEQALSEVNAANAGAFTGHASLRRIEVYHPVQPDPSDVIPRTDLAGLKVYVAGLKESDQAQVSLWNAREPKGDPAFKKRLARFAGQELLEGWFFVRLPLELNAGWHTVRVDLNGKETVDYRFITW